MKCEMTNFVLSPVVVFSIQLLEPRDSENFIPLVLSKIIFTTLGCLIHSGKVESVHYSLDPQPGSKELYGCRSVLLSVLLSVRKFSWN